MTDVIKPTQEPAIRIPNLPSGKIVDENGLPTDSELTFREGLLTLLQQIAGAQGLVMPQQTTANITAIATNQQTTPVGSINTNASISTYTCQPGTFIYNSTNDTVQVSVLTLGVPSFKTVTVT